MPTTDPHYHAKWVAKRRAAFFDGKLCAQCSSAERLELDHIDPAAKVAHCIWTWRESRRLEELKKCQILCHECHKKKSSAYSKAILTGRPNTACRKLTDTQAAEIRVKLSQGATKQSLADEYKVGKTTIHGIKYREIYIAPASFGRGTRNRNEAL